MLCKINRLDTDVTTIYKIYKELKDDNSNYNEITQSMINEIYNKTELSYTGSYEFMKNIIQNKGIPEVFFGENKFMEELKNNKSINTPHCPTCSSTNIKKISTTSKAVNVALFGFLGNKRKKQFHCNNCGYEW